MLIFPFLGHRGPGSPETSPLVIVPQLGRDEPREDVVSRKLCLDVGPVNSPSDQVLSRVAISRVRHGFLKGLQSGACLVSDVAGFSG